MQIFSRIVPAVAMLAAIMGCVTTILTPATDPSQMFITPAGIVHLGEVVPLEKIPARLRSADVEKNHEIRIHLNEPGHDQQTMSRLAGLLRQAGFTYIVFVVERRPSSQVVQEPDAPGNAVRHADAPGK